MADGRSPGVVRRVRALVLGVVLAASGVAATAAIQTFPDPFGGEGLFVDIRAGSRGTDIGDAFFLREEATVSLRMFLDPPNSFIETHFCLSADPFTDRIPPGQCQFQDQGAASASYDIGLPPSSFPSGTTPFSDPLGAFCVQVHVKYDAPGLALTAAGGGSAFAGWEAGSPYFGNVCFPPAPEPPPSGGSVVVSKSGAFVGGDVVFTVTVTNPTTEVAPDVVVLEGLPVPLTWSLPPECAFGPLSVVARCELGDVAGGEELLLEFRATPAPDVCGTFTNYTAGFAAPGLRAHSADGAAVDVPCPPDPPADPLVLLTKEASETSVTAPGTITYVLTFENAGPGEATDVTVIDELPPGPEWSIGSGSNVCDLEGSTLTCFAEVVPDGVFEVLEITGTVGSDGCGTLDNEGSVTYTGGGDSGSVTAAAPPVDIVGCPAPIPESPLASVEATDEAAPSSDAGQLPDTSTAVGRTSAGSLLLLAILGTAIAGIAVALVHRRRSGSRSGP